jgi:hypothetical protein
MNNEDFKRLISEGSSRGENGDRGGKKKFDLKEIERMDQQIRSKRKKEEKNKSVPRREAEDADKAKDGSQKYRNRAEERRKGENPDYDPVGVLCTSWPPHSPSKYSPMSKWPSSTSRKASSLVVMRSIRTL